MGPVGSHLTSSLTMAYVSRVVLFWSLYRVRGNYFHSEGASISFEFVFILKFSFIYNDLEDRQIYSFFFYPPVLPSLPIIMFMVSAFMNED